MLMNPSFSNAPISNLLEATSSTELRLARKTWITADEAVASRFRAYLTEHAGKDDGPPQTLMVRAWLNPDGSIERVSFPALSDSHADQDLHTILKRGNIGEAPPPEMLQPLNLRFSLNDTRLPLKSASPPITIKVPRSVISSSRRHCCRETEFLGRRQRGQNDFERVRDTVPETTSR